LHSLSLSLSLSLSISLFSCWNAKTGFLPQVGLYQTAGFNLIVSAALKNCITARLHSPSPSHSLSISLSLSLYLSLSPPSCRSFPSLSVSVALFHPLCLSLSLYLSLFLSL